MAFTRGRIIGYNTDRMMFEFTMITHDTRVITCEISSVAMDHLDGRRGTLPPEREAQFVRLRDAIEKIASGIFKDDKALQGAVVRIFVKHLPDGRKASG